MYVDHAVVLAEDVVLEQNVILRGRTTVGAGTRIASGSQIIDSAIGERCTVWASIIERSTVEDDVTIGPFSHLRPGAHVGTRSEIGNYAEIKNSRLGEHVRQHHNSYLGDADVGRDTNVARARSPPTTTACASTGQRSGSVSSWAWTRCCGHRSPWATTRRPGPGPW